MHTKARQSWFSTIHNLIHHQGNGQKTVIRNMVIELAKNKQEKLLAHKNQAPLLALHYTTAISLAIDVNVFMCASNSKPKVY
jgi:hypothetical protein